MTCIIISLHVGHILIWITRNGLFPRQSARFFDRSYVLAHSGPRRDARRRASLSAFICCGCEQVSRVRADAEQEACDVDYEFKARWLCWFAVLSQPILPPRTKRV